MEVPKSTTFPIAVDDSPLPPSTLPILYASSSPSSDSGCEAISETKSSDE